MNPYASVIQRKQSQKICQKICVPQKSSIFAPLLSNVLGYGVMVTLQILVLPFLVRVRVAQQENLSVMRTGSCFFRAH